MKKIILFSLMVIFLSSLVFAEVAINERKEIKQKVDQIVNYANSGDFNKLSEVISPNVRDGLIDEIELQLAEKSINYEEVIIGSYKELPNEQIKSSGSYKVNGPNWKGSGALMFFIFEKSGSDLLLVDTNFHQIIFPSYIFKKIGSILLFVIPLLLVMGIFWIWMLIDCIKREFSGSNEKVVWILLIILTGILGAIIYFFVIKRRK